MDFWRTGSARTFREPTGPTKGPRWWRRITGFYFPAWVPVVAIIFVVFGMLGLLFYTRTATGAPRIGKDHWHARYQFFACGQKQPNASTWESGVHTHGDGIMHIHPFQPFEEGSGARMIKWFEYGGGLLTDNTIRMPGSKKEFHNGDNCPDGKQGTLQVFVTTADNPKEEKLDTVDHYIPHDGDRIRIVFGPPEETVQQQDRTVIPETNATRTVNITVTDDGTEGGGAFDPSSIQVSQGETVKLTLKNNGSLSHGFRVAGSDGQYGTADDFVIQPDIIKPAGEASTVIRLDATGSIPFRDETSQGITGTIIVGEASSSTPSPSPTPAAQEAVDVTFDVSMQDNSFSQTELTVKAGQKFRINLKNDGNFVHDMTLAGPDKQYDTSDDVTSTPRSIKAGQTGQLVAKIDQPGTYLFRCDFHPQEMTGTLVVQPP